MPDQPTLEQLVAQLEESYDLIYVDYRDQLTADQVAQLARGDLDDLWESTAEFELSARATGARYIVDQLLADAHIDPSDYAAYHDLLDAVEERDCSDWLTRLASQTPRVLLRVSVLDEDHAYAFTDVSPEQVLADVALPATVQNVETVKATLLECSPEFSVLLGYWIASVDVSDLLALPLDPDALIQITNPYLYLGNPVMGSGFISEQPLAGTVQIRRSDLRTDRDAFGYSLEEIYGGLTPWQFTCEMHPASPAAPVTG